MRAPKAKVYMATQRCESRTRPTADLLGVFRSTDAAIACAARAEAPFAFAPGESVRLSLYEHVYKEGRKMPTVEVQGTVRERKLGSIENTVRYVVDVKLNVRLGRPGEPLKQQLSKDKHDRDFERICQEKRSPPKLRPGITGTTSVVEVSREYLQKPWRVYAKNGAGDNGAESEDENCDDDADDDAANASNGKSECSGQYNSDDDAFSRFEKWHGANHKFIVEENGLYEEIQDNAAWVAFLAANRCTESDIRACSSLASANVYSQQRFEKRQQFVVELLKDRKVTSDAKEVPADILLGRPGECLKVPEKHCFASTIRDGSFLGGICDYCEDDFSDIETDDEEADVARTCILSTPFPM